VDRRTILLNTGEYVTQVADAFCNGRSGFFRGGLTSDQAREVEANFLKDENLGSNNKLADIIGGRVNVNDLVAVNRLAARSVGPDLARGILRVDCRRGDLLGTKVNDTDTEPRPEYLALNWKDRCAKLMSFALNAVVDNFHPPLTVTANMVGDDGILTVRNLQRNFSLRDLSVLFSRTENPEICNFDRPGYNPPWTPEGVLNQTMTPRIVNIVKGIDPDDVNRNFFTFAGVNRALPSALDGQFGAKKYDNLFINGKDSGVTTSKQSRQLETYFNRGITLATTSDTNSDQDLVGTRAQNAKQSGSRNLAYAQGESWIQDQFGRMTWVLHSAPDADNGQMKRADEAPASAASAGKAVAVGQCIQCHPNGPAIFDNSSDDPHNKRSYDVVALGGANRVTTMSPVLTNARYKYQSFLMNTNSWVGDSKKVGSARPISWDAFKKAQTPKSPEWLSTSMGYPPGAIAGLLQRDPKWYGMLEVDKNGNIQPQNWQTAQCAVRKALGRPGGYTPPNSLAGGAGQGGIAHATSR
jgi:mono/diheme cytochrome c family protein